MSNKIDRFVVILIVLLLAVKLDAFIPQSRDFASEYQYRMYRSWKTRERIIHENPARITHDIIERQLQFADSEAEVVYYWKNWKINQQLENLPDWLPYSDYEQELTIAGELLYRLNCQHSIFAEHYLKKMPVLLNYDELEGKSAIDSLMSRYKAKRLPVKSMMPVFENDKMTALNFLLVNGDSFSFVFTENTGIDAMREKLYKFEVAFSISKLPDKFYIQPKPDFEYQLHAKEESLTDTIEIAEKVTAIKEAEKLIEESSLKITVTEPTDTLMTDYEKKLLNWIEKNKNTCRGTELLNNKIDDIDEFLQDEFPEHSILINGSEYVLTHVPFDQHLPANLYLEIEQEDSWKISASDDVLYKNKLAVVGGFEEFDLSALKDYEAESICRYLPQLLISHRVMNSRLSGFIMEPDMISTTLVVNGSKRSIYSINSYNDLLSMLGNFWEERTVYYTVNDFKIVDGYIEFRGYLAAENADKGCYDLAEIRYKLDEDYMMALAMMVLYPQQQIILKEGR